jgi:predicted transglutaminase-like cysteine proteinase
MFGNSHIGGVMKLGLVLVAALSMTAMTMPAAQAGKRAPLGYQVMCLKTPEQCKGGGKAKVEVTSDLMATLKRVNANVNRSIKPRNDSGADVWSASASAGDCEDYVLAKRAALVRAGVPASSLRIAYVKTKRGVGHAVLVVKTNGKDLVLDNLTATLRPVSQTGYRIVSISGANPRQWS